MIEKNIIFDDMSNVASMWCGGDIDSGELARVAEIALDRNLPFVSVMPDAVRTIWPWLENKNVKIMVRFAVADKKISEQQISNLTVDINTAFKHGAHGAQIFLPYGALGELVEQTHVIRDDLFFNKDLSIAIDINQIDSSDWENLFENLRKINATSLLITLSKDTGDKSDFVGRLYGMLDVWENENNFDVHFAFCQNFQRIEQALRLIKSVRPELIKTTKVFINY